ncbi:MAG TPA: ferric reductase-like transmembrane domain-containing protein, partial [Xanthomonadales bacterium]|nr:ferric reductase-like transmembrane domain-containing protein [Xanthomonadales bacterium]
MPLAWLAVDTARGTLGPDPVAALTHRSGDWALRLLLLALAVTPVRRLLKRPELVQLRRPLGLWAFAYATTHFSIWLLDMQGYWSQVLADIAKRPFITVGFAAWLLLVPLAATSTRGMMRRLGRRW